MKIKISLLFLILFGADAAKSQQPGTLSLTEEKAEYLYHFAYDCIDEEYPNKLNGVLGDDSYLSPRQEHHPAFF